MALDFRSKTTKIPQTTGARSENEGQPFGKRLRTADVALKSFKLDYVGGARPSDVAQVTVRLQSIGDEDVQYNVTTNYTGGTYTGEVTVLIIADTEDKPVPIP
jgi:acyl-CoA thioesterase FadM